MTIDARRIRVQGVVQGVGYRPFVWHLARELGLQGWVRNDAAGVEIAAEGPVAALETLIQRLHQEAPPLARVDAVSFTGAPLQDLGPFRIEPSGGGTAGTAIGHDTGLCQHCLDELFDPANRRWRHPFITCTHCGPRYTLTRHLPYDRPQTSMAAFELCPACHGEYNDPADRRFHAEPICCLACGPRLSLWDDRGQTLAGDSMGKDPIAETLALLRTGAVVAIKGLGGFHLACDARNAAAVARLRVRKQREEKPFAIMGAGLGAFREVATVSAGEAELLVCQERPIVLCEKGSLDLAGIAPGLSRLGLMLPGTPIQYLLFHEQAGRPAGTAWLDSPPDLLLVMTSANPGGEPLVIGNDEAQRRLAGIADAFLFHDRDIVIRCDDSVRTAAGFIRRARGYTPRAVPLARSGPPVLALGGWFKNTVCVARGAEAFVSQHVGDLDTAEGCRFLEETVAHLLGILALTPAAVACDRHPDFHSSRYAQALAEAGGVPLVMVQHHHAHIAAVVAEHQYPGPVLGLALDGVGLGLDGQAWGGELLRVEGARMARLGHLAPLPLPGGDRAAEEPWRMGAAVLHQLGRSEEIQGRFPGQAGAAMVRQMLAQGVNCPPTSSLGRVFDGAAALLHLPPVAAFEGQAAMLLEGLAERHGPALPLREGWRLSTGQLDLSPLWSYLADRGARADLRPDGEPAAVFHATLAAALAEWVAEAAAETGIDTVAGAGGCFLNRLLRTALRQALQHRGLRLMEAKHLPPNDGGLSLGQAWVARCTLEN